MMKCFFCKMVPKKNYIIILYSFDIWLYLLEVHFIFHISCYENNLAKIKLCGRLSTLLRRWFHLHSLTIQLNLGDAESVSEGRSLIHPPTGSRNGYLTDPTIILYPPGQSNKFRYEHVTRARITRLLPGLFLELLKKTLLKMIIMWCDRGVS